MAKMLLPGGLKMATLAKAIGKVTPLQFQILFVLLDNADRETGLSIISHEAIAARVGCRKRAAQEATRRLDELGLAQVERRRIGQRANGSAVYGGEGGCNRYQMLAGRMQLATSTKGRSSKHERALEKHDESVSENADTLSLTNFPKNLPCEVKEKCDLATMWSAVKQGLAAAYGLDTAEVWYGKLQLVSIEGGVVTLKAPDKFFQRQIEANHLDRLLRGWRAEQSTIEEVRIACQ